MVFALQRYTLVSMKYCGRIGGSNAPEDGIRPLTFARRGSIDNAGTYPGKI